MIPRKFDDTMNVSLFAGGHEGFEVCIKVGCGWGADEYCFDSFSVVVLCRVIKLLMRHA